MQIIAVSDNLLNFPTTTATAAAWGAQTTDWSDNVSYEDGHKLNEQEDKLRYLNIFHVHGTGGGQCVDQLLLGQCEIDKRTVGVVSIPSERPAAV